MHWSAPVSCFHTRPIYSTYSTCCPVLPRAVSIHVLCPSWSNTKSILNSMCLTNGSTIFCRSVTSYSCLGMRFSAKSSTGSISIVSLIFVPNLFDWVTTWSPPAVNGPNFTRLEKLHLLQGPWNHNKKRSLSNKPCYH